MSWNPSIAQQQLHLVQPARPLMYDASNHVFTPFLQSPARDVLRHLPHGTTDAAALFLGCADGSCLLASLAADHPGLRNLLAVLNDYNPFMLAKAALILLMAAELDPDSQSDMQVLWEVWYCAFWSAATLPRVKHFIERLHQGSVPWLSPLRPEDKEILQEVWSWWLKPGKPSVAKVKKWREDLKSKIARCTVCKDFGQEDLVKASRPQMVKYDSYELVEDALKDVKPPSGVTASEHVMRQEVSTWCESGYLAPNYLGQQPFKPTVANITMLHPELQMWRCKTVNTPALCWGPFDGAELVSAIKSGSPSGIMARACIALITQVVRSFQANTCLEPEAAAQDSCRVRLQVQLVCMHATQLCMSMPLADPQETSTVASKALSGGDPHAEQSGTPPKQFDAIDTSTIADKVGLLALLLAAGARLRRVPHARLYTGLRKWCRDVQQGSVEQHICLRELCMPVTLMPTILGLRLLNDPELDRPETTGPHDYTYRVDTFRELVWAPIPAELQVSPLPQLQEQLIGGPAGSIEATLKSIATRVCCNADDSSVRSEVGTPQLLAWLLASLSERVDMSALLDAEDSSSSCGPSSAQGKSVRERYVEKQRLLWAMRTKVAPLLPAAFQLSFITGIDILRTSLQQNAPLDLLPDDVPSCQGVAQVRLPWDLESAFLVGAGDERAVLVERQLQRQEEGKQTGSGGTATSKKVDSTTRRSGKAKARAGAAVPAGIHITDVWGGLTRGMRWNPHSNGLIFVYLPADHKLDMDSTSVEVGGLKPHDSLRTVALSTFIRPPTMLAQVLLPSACATTAQHDPSAQTAEGATCDSKVRMASWAWHVSSCTETATSYSVVLQPVPTGRNMKAPMLAAAQSLAMLGMQIQAGHHLIKKSLSGWQVSSCINSSDVATLQSTSHQVTVRMPEAAGSVQSTELHFRWPVAIGLGEPYLKTATDGGHFVLEGSISSGAWIELQFIAERQLGFKLDMRKAKPWELWPNDKAWGMAPDALNLSQLAAVDQLSRGVMRRCVRAQFHPRDYDEDGIEKDTDLNRLRIMISDLMTLKTFEAQAQGGRTGVHFSLFRTWSQSGKQWTTIIHLLVHPPVLLTQAGRPVLPVTVVDVSMCEDAICKGRMSETSFNQLLQRLGFEPGKMAPWSDSLSDGCLGARRLLLRRALACKPTAAQQSSLPAGSRIPYYYNSYLSCKQIPTPGYVKPMPEPQSGRGMPFFSCRLNELVAELDACQLSKRQEELVDELTQLMQQRDTDRNKWVSPDLKAAAQFRINWKRTIGQVYRIKSSNGQQLLRFSSPQGSSTQQQPSGHSIGAAVAQGEGLEEPTAHMCACCGKLGAKSRCGRCKAVWYCSRECQAGHWKQHKGACKA